MINQTQQRLAKALQRVPHTHRLDGSLEYGDNVLLVCKKTNGTLVSDTGDVCISNDEAYAATCSPKDVGACGRSVFSIESVNGATGLVKYGD